MQPWPELPNIRVAVFFLDWKLLTYDKNRPNHLKEISQ